MVRLIFELYSTGNYSVRKIGKILNEKGYRSRTGKRIEHNTISGIIQNPKYKEYYCGNKVRIVDFRTKEQRFLPEDEWVMFKDETGEIVPAIVSEEIWDKCNAIFRERGNAIKSRERSFKDKSVFTGKIWCQLHEKPNWRTSFSNSVAQGQPTYQWICSEKKRFGAKTCASFAIMEGELYAIISDLFKSIAVDIEDYIQTFLTFYKESDNASEAQKQITSQKVQLDRMLLKKEKVFDLYTDDAITKTEFTKRNDALKKDIEALEEDIKALEKQRTNDADYVKSIKQIETYFKTMYLPEQEMTKEQVDEMVRTIIDRIDVVPINDSTMRLEVKLKTGQSEPLTYIRNGSRYGRRSGHISNKIASTFHTLTR